MAYQNVGTPRFYINVFEWLDSIGVISISPVYRTLPVIAKGTGGILNGIPEQAFSSKSFIAFLGHASSALSMSISFQSNPEIGVNADATGNVLNPEHHGFSIRSFTNYESMSGTFNTENVSGQGSTVVGTYYNMPHSPDLSLTLTREYGGIKTIETKGGASLSNAFYTKPPAWGSLGAWELGSGNTALSRSGRRVWDLSFSYLQDSDVFPDNLTEIENTGWEIVDDITPDFMSEVVRKTNGGQLPFIFQPDGGVNGNNNPDQFAICKFDMKSFSFQQTAPNLYSVKMKIREVW
jgi:hypothetical protein